MPARIQFGVYELDCDGLELRKHGIPIRLQEQPLLVLTALVERPGEIVTRDQLQQRIWGKDTFVDFDQSLNKAVNRLREALNDDPAHPRYVETVPRRGYRFVAPITENTATKRPEGTVHFAEKSGPHRSRFAKIAALATAGILMIIGVTGVTLLRKPQRLTTQEATHMTSFGFAPALSRDGRLLAFSSTVGGGTPHVWVQQTVGGEATQLTRGSQVDVAPDFSPDGTHIAFEKEGGGIYIAPTLPGEPRLLVMAPHAGFPRFSPSGDSIMYWQDWKAFIVSVTDSQPVSLALNQSFRVYAAPFWSPNGKEILFYGVENREINKPGKWWIAPFADGSPRAIDLPRAEQNYVPGFAVRAWLRTPDEREWIIYSTATPESWKLWRVGVSARDAIGKTPELLASGNGRLGPGGAASADGKLTYNTWSVNHSIYQVSTTNHGQKVGPTIQLSLSEGGDHQSPSVSRDGRWMAYDSSSPGRPNSILLRDLRDDSDHFIDDKGRKPLDGGETSISPDGSKVIFQRECKEGQLVPWANSDDTGDPAYCGFLAAASGGIPEQVCKLCTPRGFSSDGSVVLLQRYDLGNQMKDRIVSLDLRTRMEREFLNHPDKPLFHAYFSWDDRWVVFKKLFDLAELPAQILIAPVRHGTAGKESEWIAVTDGLHADDKPQFSSDGNTVFFTSTRDGYLCVWAQRLDPATKQPLGVPFAYEHFHNSAGRAAAHFQGESDLSVARDKMLINLPEVHSDIWMTQMR
jgi:Tol biopolymer transport system component/DNA-binding winged helix-turn-helix (wHTH) protein